MVNNKQPTPSWDPGKKESVLRVANGVREDSHPHCCQLFCVWLCEPLHSRIHQAFSKDNQMGTLARHLNVGLSLRGSWLTQARSLTVAKWTLTSLVVKWALRHVYSFPFPGPLQANDDEDWRHINTNPRGEGRAASMRRELKIEGKAVDVAQLTEYLPSMHQVLGLILSTA